MAAVLRKLSLLLALAAGCIALLWGLLKLHSIFVQERDDALAAIAGRRRALEQYAHKELDSRLRSRLAEARPTIAAAAADPLIPAGKMWLVDSGQQLLPRINRPRGTNVTPASNLYNELIAASDELLEGAQRDDPDGPWTERLLLLQQLKMALVAGDRDGIESRVREILSHRAAYMISITREVPYTLAVLTLLRQQSEPAYSLMEALLRKGLSGRSAHLEGLQRLLLRNRSRFNEADMTSLARRVVELSVPSNVLYHDFDARVAEPSGDELELPEELNEPMLLYQGVWYVEPARNARIYGLAIEIGAVLDEITSAMRERALIGDADTVKTTIGASTVAVSALALQIDSPQWQPAMDAVQSRYRLKAALEVIIALLAFGVMSLAAWVYRRRNRFLELKSDFVSAVSHELRTPLASIRLMAETLERRTQDLPKARDYPARIIRDVDGLSFLVENVLSFNRLSSGRWTPVLEQLSLARAIDKLDSDRDSWARKVAELSWDRVAVGELRADPDLVQLLLTNLARNACAYNERDPVTVHIDAERSDDAWLVRVRDNGVGIPASEQASIFDDFYRASRSTGARGSGLGLSICRKIMHAHGGSIGVVDSSAEGTTFELRFPDET